MEGVGVNKGNILTVPGSVLVDLGMPSSDGASIYRRTFQMQQKIPGKSPPNEIEILLVEENLKIRTSGDREWEQAVIQEVYYHNMQLSPLGRIPSGRADKSPAVQPRQFYLAFWCTH